MNKTLAMVVTIAAVLSGCSTTGGMGRMTSYSFPVHHVETANGTFRVYAHKTDNSLMVAPSLGRTMAAGATWGAATLPTELSMKAAAQQYLVNSGRGNCRVTRGGLLVQPNYEFWYEC